jgi:hypothetical protein
LRKTGCRSGHHSPAIPHERAPSAVLHGAKPQKQGLKAGRIRSLSGKSSRILGIYIKGFILSIVAFLTRFERLYVFFFKKCVR